MPTNATVIEKCSTPGLGSYGGLAPRPAKAAVVVQQERLGAMSQMARGIAHDINNSLTPIIGYADFILETQTGLSEDLRKYLACIRTAAGDIAFRVEQVRQFYRLRDPQEVLQVVNVRSVAEEVLEATHAAREKLAAGSSAFIAVETEWAENLAPIRENPFELREAIRQVVLNAMEAMPEGGRLTLAALRRDAQIVLEVRDTGVGMTDEMRQHCFEPFSSSKLRRGSGLGLAMVYGFMRRHKGSIELDSELGVGTTLRLIFHAENRRTKKISSAHRAVGNGKRHL